MLLSIFCQLPLVLLLSCLTDAKQGQHHRIHKRDPSYNVLNGANFPDPSIINLNGVSYVFGTNDGAGHNIPLTQNSNFNDASGWSAPVDAFPEDGVPAFANWAEGGTTWAPDVNQLTDGDGSFAMYYAAALQSNNLIHCVSLARSLNVAGPYNDSSSAPMICPESAGGAIDAAGFLDDDGSRYVVYKIDGPAINNGGYCNSPNNPPSTNTSLMLLQVQNDGYTVIAGPANLYNNDGVDDKYNIEAPDIVKGSDGTYFLFFSSGCTSDNSYTTSYVTSTSIWGPYGNRQILLQTGDFGEYGPGGADIDQASGDMVYHSLEVSNNISFPRVLNTAQITLNGQSASVN